MPVNITISHEFARGALDELRIFAGGLTEPAPQGAMLLSEVADQRNHMGEQDNGEVLPPQPAPVAAQPAGRGRGRPRKEPAVAAPAAEQPMMTAAQAEELKAPAVRQQEAEAEQDAADEAEESAATAPKHLTHDDVRGALGEYVKKFNIEQAYQEGPKIIGYEKISDVPDDQTILAEIIRKIHAVTATDTGLAPAKDVMA